MWPSLHSDRPVPPVSHVVTAVHKEAASFTHTLFPPALPFRFVHHIPSRRWCRHSFSLIPRSLPRHVLQPLLTKRLHFDIGVAALADPLPKLRALFVVHEWHEIGVANLEAYNVECVRLIRVI